MFKITIIEIPTPNAAPEEGKLPLEGEIQRYAQTVDTLNLQDVIRAINPVPRKTRSDNGKKTPRAPRPAASQPAA